MSDGLVLNRRHQHLQNVAFHERLPPGISSELRHLIERVAKETNSVDAKNSIAPRKRFGKGT